MALQTEFPFTLPKGYVDREGTLHRHGTMRLATARDEIEPLRDPRVSGSADPYLTILVIARVISSLGTLRQVTPNEVDKSTLEALRQKLSELPKVQQAQLDLVWVERLAAILKLGDRFVFGLTVLLVSALLLVIGNTIRLHIENRRTEIEVIKLVGGTDSYVRRPFLYMGALYGFGAGLLSWGVLAFGLNWLNDAVVGLAGLYGSDFALAGVPVADGLSLLLGAVLLGYIGAWIAVARHLRELAPK